MNGLNPVCSASVALDLSARWKLVRIYEDRPCLLICAKGNSMNEGDGLSRPLPWQYRLKFKIGGFICHMLGSHKWGDWGYGGGDKADVWCDRCNCYAEVSQSELPPHARKIVWEIMGKNIEISR